MTRPISILLLALLIPACAPAPRAAFPQIQSTIHSRLNADIHWNQNSAEDAAVGASITSLLQQSLTADSAVQIALLNNPKLQATYESLGIAQADLVQAGLLKNPVLSFDIRFPGRPHYPVDLNIEQEFLDLFLLPLRQKIATTQFDQTQLQVTDSVLRHALDTRAAYYKLQGSLQLLELRQTSLAAAEASAAAATALHDAGNIADLALTQNLALRDQAKLDLAAAEAATQQNREALNLLMGVWGQQDAWTLPNHLPDPPDTEVALPGLESLALQNRLDLAAQKKSADRAAQEAGFANYAAFASTSVGLSYARDADVASTLGPSLKIPIPLFDQGQAAQSRAAATLRQAQQNYESAALEIRVEVRTLYSQMIAAHARAHFLLTVLLPRQHQILDQTQLHYNAMAASPFDLLNARQSELTTAADYIEALTTYWTARAQLQRALGGKYPAGGTG